LVSLLTLINSSNLVLIESHQLLSSVLACFCLSNVPVVSLVLVVLLGFSTTSSLVGFLTVSPVGGSFAPIPSLPLAQSPSLPSGKAPPINALIDSQLNSLLNPSVTFYLVPIYEHTNTSNK
jgi:hypothetical protein